VRDGDGLRTGVPDVRDCADRKTSKDVDAELPRLSTFGTLVF